MLFVNCPHCDQIIEILAINCAIFRCAVIKQTGEQLNPHAPKMECDRLAEQGLIYGCGKPFRLEPDPSNPFTHRAVICDYI
jgi:hypothetical protein